MKIIQSVIVFLIACIALDQVEAIGDGEKVPKNSCLTQKCRDRYPDFFDRRQRRLKSFLKDPERKLAVSEVAPQECASETYTLSLSFADGAHLYLTGQPKCDGSTSNENCENCPNLAFHSVKATVDEEEELVKMVDEFETIPEQNLELGFYELEILVGAYNDASVGAGNKYSFLKNNCASFLIDIGRKLDLNPTNRNIVKFVSYNLHTNAQPLLMEELSKHDEGVSMITAHNDDGAVIETFVSNYIGDRVPDDHARNLRECDLCNDMWDRCMANPWWMTWVCDMRKYFCTCPPPELPQM